MGQYRFAVYKAWQICIGIKLCNYSGVWILQLPFLEVVYNPSAKAKGFNFMDILKTNNNGAEERISNIKIEDIKSKESKNTGSI